MSNRDSNTGDDSRDQSVDASRSGFASPVPQPAIPNIPARFGSPAQEHAQLASSPTNDADESLLNARRQWRRQRQELEPPHDGASGSSRPSSTAPIEDDEVPTPHNPADLDSVPISDEQKARIIERHLNLPEASGFTITASEHGNIPASSPRHSNSFSNDHTPDTEEPEYFRPHHMQGGAITEDIYRWAHQNRRRAARRTRSESVHLPRTATIDPELDVEQIRQPGGFRRFFVLNHAAQTGQPPPRALRSFIDFLSLYGHFAGEDLNDLEAEDEDEEDEETGGASAQAATTSAREAGNGRTERSALLRRQSTRRRLGRSGSTRGGDQSRGEASVTEAVMMLLKSFVGTGILFLGKGFFNGGLVFSGIVLCAVALISLVSFLLLVKANLACPASFGDMGGILYGEKMRLAILTSIVFSQLGFVAAYTVFVAQNLQAFVLAVTHCKTFIPSVWFILLQCAIFVPLSMIRRIAKLSSTALIADVFILFGIIYLFQYEIREIAEYGIADVAWFNSETFPLFIGTAVFTFEGVGLVIPITESMKEPERFPKALSGVMIIVMILFTSSGALSYSAFGSKTQTVVITNLPQDSKFVQAMLFLYSIAILLSTPLQLFPAVSILERGLFSSKSGKYNLKVKIAKNVFRGATVVVSCLAAWAGSSSLDVFVSFIGAVFCVPLCFIFPPLLALKAMPDRSLKSKCVDYFIFVFGAVSVVFAGSQTIKTLFFGGGGGGGGGDMPVCSPPPK